MAVAFAGEMGLSVWIGTADMLEAQRCMKDIDLRKQLLKTGAPSVLTVIICAPARGQVRVLVV